MCLGILYKILFIVTISKCSDEPKQSVARHIEVIELLAEQHPYVVALLDENIKYICSGTVISEWSILTSGYCVNKQPKYVSVGLASIRKDNNSIYKKALLEVADTRLHQDYLFDINEVVSNLTRIHSNIGIVHVARPIQDWYHTHAELGDYFASELESSNLKAVSFGILEGTYSVVLQHQRYVTSPCANPKWYYCICGSEGPYEKTYEDTFGNGGPVLYETQVVGVTVSCCGKLWLNVIGPRYNIFTVTGPYISWIKKMDENMNLLMRTQNSKAFHIHVTLYYPYYVIFFLLINYLKN